MDRYSLALTAHLLIACAPAAQAVSNTELSVSGLITPSACTPSLSDGGIVDHRKVTVKDLNARLTAFTTIVPANDLTLYDEIPIDGHATCH